MPRLAVRYTEGHSVVPVHSAKEVLVGMLSDCCFCCLCCPPLLRVDLAFRRRSCSPWAGCNFIPEDLHPKSFRGSIGHNTNVWAVRDRAGMPVGGPTGVFDMEQVTTNLALLALTARCTGARIRLAKRQNLHLL